MCIRIGIEQRKWKKEIKSSKKTNNWRLGFLIIFLSSSNKLKKKYDKKNINQIIVDKFLNIFFLWRGIDLVVKSINYYIIHNKLYKNE